MIRNEQAVERVMGDYPRIYLACHQRHVPDPAGGHALSAHQASILSHLDDVESTRLGDLAGHMGVTLSTMSLHVERLVRRGYVLRERDARDRRALSLRLTESGVRMKRAQSVLEPARVAALLARLDPAGRRAALDGLSLLARAADEEMRARGQGESPFTLRAAR